MTTRTSGLRRLSALALLGATALLPSACASDESVVASEPGSEPSSEAAPVLRGCETEDDAAASGTMTYHQFNSLDDWAEHAQAVVRFDVLREVEGPAGPEPIEGETVEVRRYLDLKVTTSYSGPHRVGDVVRIWDSNGWDRSEDGALVPIQGPDCFRLEVGDDMIGALLGDGSDIAESGLFTPESALLVEGDRIAVTLRAPLVLDELEGRPVSEVEGEIRKALG